MAHSAFESCRLSAVVAAAIGVLCGCASRDLVEPAPQEELGSQVSGVHMAELSKDFGIVYLTNTAKDEVVAVDARSLSGDASDDALLNRAYIVSRDSGELDVLDLRTLELSKIKNYGVLNRVSLGAHPTHLSLSRDGRLLAVMEEEEGSGAVSFVDARDMRELKRLPGFFTPHFMRFAPDGRYGYVANLNAHHLTRVDLEKLEIDAQIPLDGFEAPPHEVLAPDEGGFADAQIDAEGVLYAAHSATNRVLVYDTVKQRKLPELPVGNRPWIVYAEHPFAEVRTHVVPNFGDRTVSLINGAAGDVTATIAAADRESFGVNYSSLVANQAFVMNRFRKNITVVDTVRGEELDTIPVGGNTETAATTRDGRWIVATVSSANRVVVIDAVSHRVVKTFDDVGDYPWAVTIPKGQNYCH
ncbi:MAG TPA: hypothetical protein VFQ61_38580 [Polyangiaceae bacterium]|nr:hypothetical protein [Polyangiaceae bacterium]